MRKEGWGQWEGASGQWQTRAAGTAHMRRGMPWHARSERRARCRTVKAPAPSATAGRIALACRHPHRTPMRHLAALALLTLAAAATAQTPAPRNVVLMIADGFGPASATLARAAAGRPLALDALLVGAVETGATDSRVTDSAAGATAFACGIKTYNGAIGVDTTGAPCRTLLEAAEARGMATGLVATSRITHATPAAFAAHIASRADEAAIAAQMIEAGVDLMVGGGARFFQGRADGRDLLAEAAARGVAVATDRAGFDALGALPALVLLAPDHLAYEIDRDETDQPSLAAMTARALDRLAATPAAREHGFFLMIEGSRIDHAGHGNDAPAHLRDILAYDAAVAAVLEWATADGATLVVSTADHETGGLALGRDGVYAYDAAPLLAATMSAERLAAMHDGTPTAADVAAALGDAAPDSTYAACSAGTACVAAFRDTTARRAGVAWTTTGHTAVDVGLYAFGPGAERFHGTVGNDAVGRALFAALGLAP